MRLRDYTPADLARLHALDQSCFEPGIAYSKRELRGFLESPSAFTVLAVEGAPETVLGFAIVRNVRMQGGAALHIITIDVDPQARRRGVGRVLMQWMEERALSLGSSSMRLEVGAENVAARAFYEAAGFAETGRIPDYYGPALDALVMQRPLSLHAESTSR